MFKRIAPIFILTIAISGTAWAHDVWFVPDGNQHRLVYGHPGDLVSYDPGKTGSVVSIDADGKRNDVPTRIRNQELVADIPASASLVITDYDNGFWTTDRNDNTQNVSKREVPNYASSKQTTKFNKALFKWTKAAGTPVGAEFEVVPLANPFTLNPGERLPVQLLFKGKPLAGAEIEILGDMELYFTDTEGKASLPISSDSFQYILARHGVALDNHPDADELAMETNLTFFR